MEQQIGKILKTDSTSAERLEGYHQIIKILQEEKEIPTSLLTSVSAIFHQLKEDIACDHVKISQDALYFLGVLLSQPMIVSSVHSDRVGDIIKDICRIIKTTSEKAVCTRALWCLMKQRTPMDIYVNKLTDILHSLEYASQMFSKTSISVEIEAIRVLNRLLTELPEALAIRSGMWARRLYLATLHPNHKVREVALATLIAARPCLETQQCELLSRLISDLKETIVPEMLKLFKEKQELHVLKLWNVLLDVLGKTLHQGATLINNLLTVVEKAFKSPIPEVKIAAFKCWQHLIDNFGTELDVLANPKRLRLVMQPLKANNARAESIAQVKFEVWWHLCICLGPKLTANMEMVANPLLQICFGLSESSNQLNSSTNGVSTPKLNLSTASVASSPGGMHTFLSVHRLGCECLAQILSHGQTLSITPPTYTIATLTHSVLTSSIFLHHANLLLSALREGISRLSCDKKDLHLQLFLWHSVVAHIRTISESENIKDASDVLSAFFTLIEDFVKANNPSGDVVLKLIEITASLPQRILTSSALSISSSSVMNGTPSLFLITMLFNPYILKSCSSQERFITTFQKLVSTGVNINTPALSFIHSVMKLLDAATAHIELSEILYQLWGIVVFPLLEYIQKNQEVNQGDALEHDFSCVYAVLLYPIQHLFKRPLMQNNLKTLVRTWSDLYRTAASCAALVPNTEGNICCEELSYSIYSSLVPSDLEDILLVEYLSQLLLTVITTVNFSPASLQDPLTATAHILTASPSARMKRKQKPLGNLTSFMRLIKDILTTAVASSGDKALHLKIVGTLIDVVQHLYSHLTVSKLIGAITTTLSSSVSQLFHDSLSNDLSKTQQGQHMTKLESMLNAVVNCIQMNFNGPYDSDFLAGLSPLLEETLLFPRKNVRMKSRSLWLSGFSECYDSLNVSKSLLAVLKKVKPPVLPGSIDNDETMDGIVANSGDENDSQSQNSELVSSPRKINVLLHNKVEDNQFKVPTSEEKMETSTSTKRPRVDDMDDKEFTKIVPEVKRRRLLTDHQKEVLGEKSDIPAMYNDLSQSQDVICVTTQLLDEVESQEALASKTEAQVNEVQKPAELITKPSEITSLSIEPQSDGVLETQPVIITIDSQESVAGKVDDVQCNNEEQTDDAGKAEKMVIVIEESLPEDSAEWLESSAEGKSAISSEGTLAVNDESQSLLESAPESLIATVDNEHKVDSVVECQLANEKDVQGPVAVVAENEAVKESHSDEGIATDQEQVSEKPIEHLSALEEQVESNSKVVEDSQKISDITTVEIQVIVTDKVLNLNGSESTETEPQIKAPEEVDDAEKNSPTEVAPLPASLVKYISTNKANSSNTSLEVHSSVPENLCEMDDIIPSSQVNLETAEQKAHESEAADEVNKPLNASSTDSDVSAAKSDIEVVACAEPSKTLAVEQANELGDKSEENKEPVLPRRRGRPPKWATELHKKEKEVPAQKGTEQRVLRSRFKERCEKEKESEKEPVSAKKMLSSAEIHVVATPSNIDDANLEEMPLVVADTVEITAKVEEKDDSSDQRLIADKVPTQEAERDSEPVTEVAASEVVSSEILSEDAKVTPSTSKANDTSLHDVDQDSDSSVEPEPCITYSAPVDKNDESSTEDAIHVSAFADVYQVDAASVPLANDEVTVGQEDEVVEQVVETDSSVSSAVIKEEPMEQTVEQNVEVDVPTSVVLTDDQLSNDGKDVIYVMSDNLDDGAVNVLVDSGIEIEIAKEGGDINDLSQGIKLDPSDIKVEEVNKQEEDDQAKEVEGKSNDKGLIITAKRPLKRKGVYSPYRPEDELLTFIPQGNMKTYSRDSSIMKHYVVRAEGDGMLGITHRSPLINRMNRGGRLLDAATKKNLDAYEKMKYEQRRSFEKIEECDETERKSEQSLPSTDNLLISEIGNMYPELSVHLKAGEASPSTSPSSGILKKRKLEFASSSSTGSPNHRQRRVSFADPLVQDEVDHSDWSKEQSKVAVSQCLELNTTDSVTYTASSPSISEQQVTQVQCVPQTVELAHLPEVSESAEVATTSALDAAVEVSEMQIVDGTIGSTENSEVITVQLYGDIAGSEVSEVTTDEVVHAPVEAENCQYQQMEIAFEVDESKKDLGHIVYAEIPCSTSNDSIDVNEAVVLASSDVTYVEAEEKTDVKTDVYIDPQTQTLLELPAVAETSEEQTKEVVAEQPMEVDRITVAANDIVTSPDSASADQTEVSEVVSEQIIEPVTVSVPESEKTSEALTPEALPAALPAAEAASSKEVVSVGSNTVPVASCAVSEDSGEPPSKVMVLDSSAVLRLADSLCSSVTADTIRRMPVTDILYLQKQLCDTAATVASSLLSLSKPRMPPSSN